MSTIQFEKLPLEVLLHITKNLDEESRKSLRVSSKTTKHTIDLSNKYLKDAILNKIDKFVDNLIDSDKNLTQQTIHKLSFNDFYILKDLSIDDLRIINKIILRSAHGLGVNSEHQGTKEENRYNDLGNKLYDHIATIINSEIARKEAIQTAHHGGAPQFHEIPTELYFKIILLISPSDLDELKITSKAHYEMFDAFINDLNNLMENSEPDFIIRLNQLTLEQLTNLKYYIRKYHYISNNDDEFAAQSLDEDEFITRQNEEYNNKKTKKFIELIDKKIATFTH